MKQLTTSLPPQLTLQKTEHGWTMTYGDLWESRLTQDEALGTVAAIVYAGKTGYLRSKDEHEAWARRYGYLDIFGEFGG